MDQQPGSFSFHAQTGARCRIRIVDIGAHAVASDPPAFAGLLQDGHADVVGFEPNPAALADLNARKGPHETYLPHAVGDGGSHTLHFCELPTMNSLLAPNRKVLELFHGFGEWGRVVGTASVETVRLDDLEETRDADLIKLDIQGAELMALRHGVERLRAAVAVQTEVEFLPMYVDQPMFADVDQFIRQHGFMFHRFYPTYSRVVRPMVVGGDVFAGLSQVLCADAIYIRDITRLDRFRDDQLLKLAAILHDCYGSFDLAYHLLLEHDQRRETAYAAAYMAGLQGRDRLPMNVRSARW
jgi:FkbM family methyltransferase